MSRAAAVQLFATPFNLNHNLETAGRLARQAAAQGARVVVLPELFNTGYVYSRRLFASAEDDQGPTLRWLAGLSAELRVCIGGTLLLREEPHIFDVFALACPDGRVHRYKKQYPFAWERCFFEAGREPAIAETDFGRFGLMIGWDVVHRRVWESYRGRVDAVLIASSPPRLHRAVLNFPLGRKLYLAQMIPALLRRRDEIDGWHEAIPASGAAWLRVPIVHAVMAGRFVTEVPFARASFLGAALTRPRYWPWARQAGLASLRATFYGCSALFSATGETLAKVDGDEGIAAADVAAPTAPGDSGDRRLVLPTLPFQLRLLDRVIRPLSRQYYRRHL